MMHKLLTAGLLLGLSTQAYPNDLKNKFSAALQVVAESTMPVSQKPIQSPAQDGGQSVGQAYASGSVKQDISAKVDTEAQELLLDVADVVSKLAFKLIEGTRTPSEALRLQACDYVNEGMEKRRYAPFYQGYNELHQDFKEYLYQFTAIGDILECSL